MRSVCADLTCLCGLIQTELTVSCSDSADLHLIRADSTRGWFNAPHLSSKADRRLPQPMLVR